MSVHSLSDAGCSVNRHAGREAEFHVLPGGINLTIWVAERLVIVIPYKGRGSEDRISCPTEEKIGHLPEMIQDIIRRSGAFAPQRPVTPLESRSTVLASPY